MEKLKLAIVGCGAISELFHIPAALKSKDVELVAVVDKDLKRAEFIAKKFSINIFSSDYSDIFNSFEAAVIAVPNVYHAPIATTLLKNGKHCLVEKPFALTAEEAENMIAESKLNRVILGAANVRRFYPENTFVKTIIKNKLFGNLRSITIQEGYRFEWPMASDSFLRKDIVGGGVLVDIGVHVIDLIHMWVDDLQFISYFDDAKGGLENDCKINLSSEGVNVEVELSRQRNLGNKIELEFDDALVSLGTELNSSLKIRYNHAPENLIDLKIINDSNREKDFSEIIQKQLEDFVASVKQNRDTFVTGSDALKAIKTVEECYGNRQELLQHWEEFQC